MEELSRSAIGLRMNKELWHEFKIEALKERRTCGELVEELIQNYLQGKQKKQKRP